MEQNGATHHHGNLLYDSDAMFLVLAMIFYCGMQL